jgi:hypothetical protein
MKRIILLSLVSTLAVANPYYKNSNNYNSNIQWSRQANIYANQSPSQQYQRQHIKKLYGQPYKKVTYKTKKTAPPFSYTSQKNKIDLLIGGNIFLDNDDIDNAMAAGIRYSRLLSGSNYVQVGYEGVFGADYNSVQNISPYSNDSKNISNNNNQNITTFGELDFHRLYINAMHEFLNYKALYPYMYAGLGFEFISEDDISLENSSFFQTGLGLRYDIGQYSLLSDVKALKRLNSSGDMNVVATLGFGMAFGQEAAKKPAKRVFRQAPLPKMEQNIVTKQETKPYYNPQPIYKESTPTYTQQPSYDQYETISDKAYYIQMGAFESHKNIENSNYTNRINNMGLDTIVKQVYRNNHPIKLLLVGPYYSEMEARADLNRAKSVVRGAFIKKIVD